MYEVVYGTNTNGSEWIYESISTNLTYIASPNNMMIVLSTSYYYGFPLAVNVSSWGLSKNVTIGIHLGTVVDEFSIAGYDCWKCEIEFNSCVYYDKVTGIYVQSYFIGNDGTDRTVILEEIIFEEPPSYLRRTGVLVSGIFVELAVIIWLLADRLKKKSK